MPKIEMTHEQLDVIVVEQLKAELERGVHDAYSKKSIIDVLAWYGHAVEHESKTDYESDESSHQFEVAALHDKINALAFRMSELESKPARTSYEWPGSSWFNPHYNNQRFTVSDTTLGCLVQPQFLAEDNGCTEPKI